MHPRVFDRPRDPATRVPADLAAVNEQEKRNMRQERKSEIGERIFYALVGCLLVVAWSAGHAEPLGPATPPAFSASQGSNAETKASVVRAYLVPARNTDPEIGGDNGRHVALIGNCAKQRGLLYLFLPGTRGVPSPNSPLLRLAARNCLQAISLAYPNNTSVFPDCRFDPAERDCYAAWRLEKIDGVDRSDKIRITPSNSIENRLLKLLEFLALRHPGDGWERYVENGAVRWQDVIVSGQSQGGGEAAMLAKIHSVARVALFGAVTDAVGSLAGQPAAWESASGATPPERYYGFAHERDNFWPAIQRGWDALGLDSFGPIVNVDSDNPPFGGSHRLTTGVPCVNPLVPNCAHTTVVNPELAERFLPVWEYVMGLRLAPSGLK